MNFKSKLRQAADVVRDLAHLAEWSASAASGDLEDLHKLKGIVAAPSA
jgi:hypothetical protein